MNPDVKDAMSLVKLLGTKNRRMGKLIKLAATGMATQEESSELQKLHSEAPGDMTALLDMQDKLINS